MRCFQLNASVISRTDSEIDGSPVDEAFHSLLDLIEVGAVGGLLVEVAAHCGALLGPNAQLKPGDVIVYDAVEFAIVAAVSDSAPLVHCYRRRGTEIHAADGSRSAVDRDVLGVLRLGRGMASRATNGSA
jgi:hypothetical protein